MVTKVVEDVVVGKTKVVMSGRQNDIGNRDATMRCNNKDHAQQRKKHGVSPL